MAYCTLAGFNCKRISGLLLHGPQNYAKWSNKEFDTLAQQIDRETDAAQRKALVRQAELITEQDPPLLPVSCEKIYDGWYTYVKGVNPYHIFGIYDVVRWNTTMAAPKRASVTERDLHGFKYVRLLGPLLDHLHVAGTERDRAGNRQLFDAQYATLLLYFLSPLGASWCW